VHALQCRHARERFRDEVALKFLLENLPVDLGVPIEPGRRTTVTRGVVIVGEQAGCQAGLHVPADALRGS